MKKQFIYVDAYNNKFYYQDKKMNKLHREDGPAIELANGDKEWWLNSKLHREDGPAVEFVNGDKSWWLNGEYLSQEEHACRTQKEIVLTPDEVADLEELKRERDEALAWVGEIFRLLDLPDGDMGALENCKLELEAARKTLSGIYRWIERRHQDGFLDSLTHEQNLDRVYDALYDRLDTAISERDEAQTALDDIEKYGTEEINAAVDLRRQLAAALIERDEAREQLAAERALADRLAKIVDEGLEGTDEGLEGMDEDVPLFITEARKAIAAWKEARNDQTSRS